MKTFIYSSVVAALMLCFVACDEDTDTIGSSLISDVDNLVATSETYLVSSKTIVADSVLSRNTTGYLGRIKDPEANDILSCDFMTQFHTLESFSMVDQSTIVSRINGEVAADSCEIRLYTTKTYGDSLTQMKLTAYEMAKPMREDTTYYSNYDPSTAKLIRNNGIQQNVSYSLTDLSVSDSMRSTKDYTPNIRIKLNNPYTDKDGKTYNNYGTYLLQKYYEDPTAFRNTYRFIHEVTPGFYFKVTNGLGAMAQIDKTNIFIYFRYQVNPDSIAKVNTNFAGTEEVLQTTHFGNDKKTLKNISEDPTCTYLKTPAGLFTELTLPVEEIVDGHENDTIVSAKITLQKINKNITSNDYSLGIPSRLLMIPRDSLYSFFEHNSLTDNKVSYQVKYAEKTGYTYPNIAGLINAMYKAKKSGNYSENWNKVVLIPISVTTNTLSSSSTETITRITHDMSMTSTRLVGGADNPNDPVKIDIIYGKFNGR